MKKMTRIEKAKKVADRWFLNSVDIDSYIEFMNVVLFLDDKAVDSLFHRSLEKEDESFEAVKRYIESSKYSNVGVSYE